eukprot:scaffold3363_cov86-Skeletonema_marinoi.AAC.1
MNQEDLIKARVARGSEHLTLELLLASSLEEALELARLEKRKRTWQSNTCYDHDDSIDCWVAGGEMIYKEALRHPDAMEVQLTHT